MSRYHSYLNSAVVLLEAYDGKIPFAAFLKNYFATHRKFGSRDRKQVAHLCYCYFRTGKAAGENKPETILKGLFLCSATDNELLKNLKPEWNKKVTLPVEEKLVVCGFTSADIFPWQDQLSEGTGAEAFSLSFFTQPDLFIRIRPGFENTVLQKLATAGSSYEPTGHGGIRLPAAFKTEDLLAVNKEVVIQDLSSQQTGEIIRKYKPRTQGPELSVWDCCAASGGKSIMLTDLFPGAQLTVSDIRESILVNLKKRFREAGIRHFTAFAADLSTPVPVIPNAPFDIILADVPCSGSGTWSRTPEQLSCFDTGKIEQYGSLQKKIVSHVIPHLKKGGLFIYITCSVFKKENEDGVSYITSGTGLRLEEMTLLKGYEKKADSMFMAVFSS